MSGTLVLGAYSVPKAMLGPKRNRSVFPTGPQIFPAGRLKALAAVLFAWTFFCIPVGSQPYYYQRENGCALSVAQFAGLESSVGFYNSTGNSALDQAFSLEVQFLQNVFQVQPRFLFYDDSNSPGAFAYTQGVVTFGLNLMRNQFRQASFGGPLGIAAIMAHEYAHILQFQTGTPSNTDTTIHRELHADFMAGWYLANRSNYLATDVLGGLLTMHSIGDRQFYSLDHHGTPEERLIATAVGVTSENLSRKQAYSRGWEYVGITYRLSGVTELTPLGWAATAGYTETVDALLAFGADPNEIISRSQITPIYIAAGLGHVGVVQALLNSGANPNSRAPDGTTALHFAVLDEETVKQGLTSSIPFSVTIRKSNTASVSIIEELLDSGADPNAEGRTGGRPLHFAAYQGDVQIVEKLLEGGANPWARAKDESTPAAALMDGNASREEKAEILRLLIRFRRDGR